MYTKNLYVSLLRLLQLAAIIYMLYMIKSCKYTFNKRKAYYTGRHKNISSFFFSAIITAILATRSDHLSGVDGHDATSAASIPCKISRTQKTQSFLIFLLVRSSRERIAHVII